MKKVMVALMAVVLVSCGGGSTGVAVKSEKALEESFLKMRDSFTKSFEEHGDKEVLKLTADSLVMFFDALSANYPENGNLGEMYFAIGEVSMKVDRAEEALKYFDALASKFPEDANVEKALYLKGQTYEDILKDTVQAIAAYKHVYKTYPNSAWSKNAGNQILHLQNPAAEQE